MQFMHMTLCCASLRRSCFCMFLYCVQVNLQAELLMRVYIKVSFCVESADSLQRCCV